MATISQRISLEGSEDIRKKLEQLGAAGAQAFKQIQDAAKKPITDPGQIDKTRQAVEQLAATSAKLGPQFQALADSTRRFGQEGAQASQQVVDALNQTEVAAQRAGTSLANAGAQVGAGLISSATAFKLAAVGIVASITAVTDALTKGAVESATAIAESAEKMKLNIVQWLKLREAISDTSTSMDAVQDATSKITDLLEKAQGGIQRFDTGMTQQAQKVGDNVIVFTKFAQSASVVKTEADKAATALGKMGISVEEIAKNNPVTLLRNLAQSIFDMGDAAKQKEAGIAAFGESWKEIVEVLRSGREVLGDVDKSLADFGRQNRGLGGADVAKAIQLKAAWSDLSKAIRATKDLIGSLFTGAAFTRAQWLTALVDGSTELLRRWLQLDDAKRGAFVADLGDTGAEQLFKIYIALSQQLSGIWRDILVPAGEKLMGIFRGISGNLEGVTKSQVAAFFISAAIAAAGLLIALKGIGLVLSPIASLLSFAFSPLGVILIAAAAAAALFWDQLKEGASAVLALLPQEIAQVQQALQLLFKGDFAGAWALFSEAAVSAFEKIKQAFLASEIGQQLLGVVNSLRSAFNGLVKVADTTAAAINRVFGTNLTGAGIGAILLVGQMTGALQALASVAVITGVAFGGFVRVLTLMGGVVGGLPLLLAGIGIALTGLIVYLDPTIWDKWKTTATNAVTAVKQLIATLGLGEVGKDLNPLVWDVFTQAALFGINQIMRALAGLTLVIQGITWAIQAVKEAWAGMPSAGPAGGVGGPLAGAEPFARGGLLGGRGTGTSDSNLAWLSRGEYVTPARAVRQPGVLAFLEALRRSGGDLARVLDGMGRFAIGGMVPRPMAIPAFATGGLAGGMSNVTIQFPGLPPIGGLRASSDVVDQLHKAAALAQVRSGGRKPSRYS